MKNRFDNEELEFESEDIVARQQLNVLKNEYFVNLVNELQSIKKEEMVDICHKTSKVRKLPWKFRFRNWIYKIFKR
jgi:hypothetical protein